MNIIKELLMLLAYLLVAFIYHCWSILHNLKFWVKWWFNLEALSSNFPKDVKVIGGILGSNFHVGAKAINLGINLSIYIVGQLHNSLSFWRREIVHILLWAYKV